MDVLSRLKASVQATVSTTVSQISHALPGNPVLREYDILSQIPVCSCGPGLFWKGYPARKKSTQQEATVFLLEKRCLDAFSRKDREQMMETVKRGVVQLTRLRHPGILTVQRAMEETRDSLAFATEPVIASLQSILDPTEQNDVQLSPVEIKYGLYQLCNTLSFLNREAKIIHTNLSPANIVIDSKGSWTLFGFDFCALNTAGPGQQAVWKCREPDVESPPVTEADLDYLAPELGKSRGRGSRDETAVSVTAAVDLYSLGCLIYSVFNGGKAPFVFEGDRESFYRRMGKLDAQPPNLTPVPLELRDLVSSLLSANPELRTDLPFILQLKYFEDHAVKALLYLDSLFQRENLHKSQFFRSLPEVLPKLPHSLKIRRVVPCLDGECKSTAAMAPFILPSLIAIVQDASQEEYEKHLLPTLRGLMKMTEPVQLALLFLKNLDLLLDKSSVESVKFDLTPLVSRSFDQPSLAEACLVALPRLASKLDLPTLRGSLLPRIRKLCMDSENLSLRVQGLLCLAKILDHLDKWTILDEVLPLLQQLPGRNQSAIIMASVGIYRLALEQPKLGIPKEYLACKVLPSLWPLTVEPSLNLVQLDALLKLIKDMAEKVESAQRQHLRSTAALHDEHTFELQNTFGINEAPKPLNGVSKAEQTHGTKVASATLSPVGNLTSQSLPKNVCQDASKTGKSAISTQSPSSSASSISKPVQPIQSLAVTPLQPIPTLSKPPAYQAKDLTSSLINSNLKTLSPDPSTLPKTSPGFTPMPNYNALNTAVSGSTFSGHGFTSFASQTTGIGNSSHQFSMNLTSPVFENAPLLGAVPVSQPVARTMVGGFGNAQYMRIGQSSGDLKTLGQKDIDDLLG